MLARPIVKQCRLLVQLTNGELELLLRTHKMSISIDRLLRHAHAEVAHICCSTACCIPDHAETFKHEMHCSGNAHCTCVSIRICGTFSCCFKACVVSCSSCELTCAFRVRTQVRTCTSAMQAAAYDLAQVAKIGRSNQQRAHELDSCGGNTLRLRDRAQSF